jgi:hypothetical protein
MADVGLGVGIYDTGNEEKTQRSGRLQRTFITYRNMHAASREPATPITRFHQSGEHDLNPCRLLRLVPLEPEEVP